jgi:antitoxin ParD1/3/4
MFPTEGADMSSISLGNHFEKFVQDQISGGRYQNASEVVRAALRLLEDKEMSRDERLIDLKAEIDAAWDDPSPSLSAEEVFESLEQLYRDMLKDAKHKRA